MKHNRKVVFLGSFDYEHLGVGYLSAMLKQDGIESESIDIQEDNFIILKKIKEIDPVLIGISVIFQYHLDLFSECAFYLRTKGVKCHFTAGGHYASLKCEELFQFIPQLNSIIRFEAEYTLPELVRHLVYASDWKSTRNLAYLENGKITYSLREPLRTDIDSFPFPERAVLKNFALGVPVTSLIASRGCTNDCSFCNVKEFFKKAGGPLKRLRDPTLVVKEMSELYHVKNCRVFYFADDDFPVGSNGKTEWIMKFCNSLADEGLKGKIIWKLSCRPDEVKKELFLILRDHGLRMVFLGIENGRDEELRLLNKNQTVSDIVKGIELLKELDIVVDYGFLLFNPSSTLPSIRENLLFLKKITKDGYLPLGFLKVMPYYDTKLEKQLIGENKLIINRGLRDYNFDDPQTGRFHDFVFSCLGKWLRSPDGFRIIAADTRRSFLACFEFLDDDKTINQLYSEYLNLSSENNNFLTDTLIALVDDFILDKMKPTTLERYRKVISGRHDELYSRLTDIRDKVFFHSMQTAFLLHLHQHLPRIHAAE